jgi:hypothetical protein
MGRRGVQQNPDKGIHGAIAVSSENVEVDDFPNVSGQQRQTDTISITSSNDGDVYEYSIDGETISYEAGSGESNSDVASAIASKHNANGYVRGIVSAVANGSDVELTGNNPGIGYEFKVVTGTHFTYNDGQDAQAAQKLEEGKAVILDSNGDIKLPEEADFAEKVLRVELTASGDGDYRVQLEVLGEQIEATYQASGDNAATIATELATDLTNQTDYLEASHVTDSGDFLEIKPETDGFAEFDVTGLDAPAEALSYSKNATGGDFEKDFQGLISRGSKYNETNGAVEGTKRLIALQRGPMTHDSASGAARNDRVFVEARTNADIGKIFSSHADGRIPVKLETARYLNSDEVAINAFSKI